MTDRSIDIDILFVSDQVIDQAGLTIPHPRLHERNFVLVPLMDLIPDFEHPVFHKAVWELYDACKDDSEIAEFE